MDDTKEVFKTINIKLSIAEYRQIKEIVKETGLKEYILFTKAVREYIEKIK